MSAETINGPSHPSARNIFRFFLGFGQVWRNKYRRPTLRRILLTDGHSPGEYHASTVRNVDAWYEAFGAKPAQTLHLTPEQRVRI